MRVSSSASPGPKPRTLVPTRKYHLEPVLEPQRHHRLRRDRMPGHEPHLPSLRQRAQHQHQLHPRKRFADAAPGAAAKRKIRERLLRRLEFRRPAFGAEPFGFVEKSRVALNEVRTDHDDAARRNDVLSNRIVGDRATANDPGWWI